MKVKTLGRTVRTDVQQEKAPMKFKDIKDILDKYQFSYTEMGIYLQVGHPPVENSWILHISVIRPQLSSLLALVLPILQEAKAAFTIAKDKETARNLVNGDLGYEQLGKIIGIYPDSEMKALFLAQQLVNITQEFRGPAIPTDYFLGGSVYTSCGNQHIPFKMPKGITWPFEDLRPFIPLVKKQLWSNKYRPLFVIKEDFKGRVIKGNYFKSLFNIRFCLIKEGIKNMWVDESGRDSTDRLLWQYVVYKELAGNISTPQIFDLFQEESNTYLVMEFIKGDSLYNKIVTLYEGNSWFGISAQNKLELIDSFLKILDAIEKLHDKGYIHRDITPANFIIDKESNVFLIDMELTYSLHQQKPNPPFKQGTPGFMSPEQKETLTPTLKEDIYALGALMINMFTGLFPSKIDSFSKDMETYLSGFTDSKRIVSLIVKCMKTNPIERPDISFVQREIKTFSEEQKEQIATDMQFVVLPPKKDLLHKTIDKALIGLTHHQVLSESHIWRSFVRQGEIGRASPIEQSPHPGLFNGISGILFFLARATRSGIDIERCMPNYNASWDYIRAHWFINPSDTKCGLCDGLAGIALALMQGLRSGLLDNSIYNVYLEKCFTSASSKYDLSEGVSGQLIALLQCSSLLNPSFTRQRLAQYKSILLEQQNKDGSWDVFRNPKEKVIGLSHGITGILYALIAYAGYQEENHVTAAIEKGMHWLTKHMHTKRTGIHWNTTTKSKSIDHWSTGMGTAGIALTFIKAYEWSKNPLYQQIAKKALMQFPSQAVYNDFSQIHGLAGLGEVYLEANRVFPDKEWQKRLDWLATLFVNTQLENDMSYWSMNNIPDREAELMIGSTGIIHFLIRYEKPNILSHMLEQRS